MENIQFCKNCAEPMKGEFCYVCGQKELGEEERKLKHFLYQFFGAAFFLERNFLKDLWALLTKPGFLSIEYLTGKRKRHMAPISLFLLINIAYFFTSPLTDLNLSLTDQLRQPLHGKLAKGMVDQKLAEESVTIEEYRQKYNVKSTSLSKSLVILNVPLMALFLAVLYVRKRHYFFGDHIVFAFHLIGFVLLFSSVIFMVLKLAANIVGLVIGQWFSSISGITLLIVGLTYFYLAVKRYYGDGWVKSIVTSFAVLVIFILTHFLYRSVLFFTVFWTT